MSEPVDGLDQLADAPDASTVERIRDAVQREAEGKN